MKARRLMPSPGAFRRIAACCGLPLAMLPARLSADAPVIKDMMPVGLVRGETVTLLITGDRVDDARELLSHDGPGIKFGQANLVKPGQVSIEAVVAADCPEGEHRVRLRTATGWSYLRLLRVASEPRFAETEPNNEDANANPMPLPATLEGEIKAEDIDVFAIDLKKGERFTAVAESVRLGRGLLDLHLSLLDEKRVELAVSDDCALLDQDPFVSVVAPSDGKYFLQVREAAYEGADGARYRVRAGRWRQPVAVHPNGGPPGCKSEVTFLFQDGTQEKRQVTWPDKTGTRFLRFADTESLISPAPLPVRVAPMPVVMETEPNNQREQASPGASAPPVALHGILSVPGDEDWFSVPLTKGQSMEVEVWGRRLGTAMDPAIDIFAPDGKHRGGNDDADGKPDSRHAFTAETDGLHFIKVRDALAAGGPTLTYRIEVRAPQPLLALSLPSPEVNNSQAGQYVTVAKGNRAALVFNITRRQADGELTLALNDAPSGIKMVSHPIPNGAGTALVLFEAAADAPEGGAFTDLVVGKSGGGLEGRHGLTANLVTYGNNEPIYQAREDRLPIAVGPPAPVQLTVRAASPLARGGLAEILVKAERATDFKQAIELRMPWKPTGVSAPPSVTLPEGATEVVFPLDAAGDASIGTHQVMVTAHWGVGSTVASGFLPVTVEEPHLKGNMEMLAVPAGGNGMLQLTVEHLRGFAGEAEVQLLGLPPGVEASPAKLKAGQTQVEIPVQVKPDAPVGKHSTLFCRVIVPTESGPIAHRLGAGAVLRIDKASAKSPPPSSAQVAEKPSGGTSKPLSRLEQLRQRATAKP